MTKGHTRPGCSQSVLAGVGGKAGKGHARPVCSRSALAGTGGKVVWGVARPGTGRRDWVPHPCAP